jgi:hypothetical protein
MRIASVIAAAGLLGGCNMVMSETPWFSAADQAGAPIVREGVWAGPATDCVFNKDDPADQWPACANGVVLRGDQLREQLGSANGGDVVTFVLAAGDPAIWQFHIPLDPKVAAEEPAPQYVYIAFVPTAKDHDGRVVAFRDWTVQCGPPTQNKSGKLGGGDIKDFPTKTPFAGLKMSGSDCTADSKDALFNAARLSETLSPPDPEMRWLRDGDK